MKDRLACSGYGDEKLIDKEFLFVYRDDAWDIEQKFLDHFDGKRAFGRRSKDPNKPLCGRGQTELFASDVLGLDKAIYLGQSVSKEASSKAAELFGGCLVVAIAIALTPFTFGGSLFIVLLVVLWFKGLMIYPRK